jgi:outer membrane lipoprotein-sorting protein
VAAGVLLFTAVLPTITGRPDIVLAMEKAVSQLKSYHGVMADGGEIWRDGEKFRIRFWDGQFAVSDGTTYWEVFPDEKRAIKRLASATADMDMRFDLARMAALALANPHEIVGTDMVAGRHTTKVLIKLPSDQSYHIWIDTETNLPLQWEQGDKLVTFTAFEVNPKVEPALFAYQPEAGYEIVDHGETIITTPAEAVPLVGFAPLMPKEKPLRMVVERIAVVMDFGTVRIVQWKAVEPFRINGFIPHGTAAGGPMAVWHNTATWVQDGIHIEVQSQPQFGDRYLELARQIAPDLKLPDPNQDLVSAAKVKVEVDMAEARALQEKMDRGDRMRDTLRDAENVGLHWAIENGKISPVHERFRLIANTGVQAILELDEGPYARIYLQKVVRPENDGIWFVVGYDPR